MLVPVDTIEPPGMQCRSLVMKDLGKFNIERHMTKLEKYPSFWVFYSTMGSDCLGKLTLTPTELVFEPLNDNFKGYFNYNGKLMITKTKMRNGMDYL